MFNPNQFYLPVRNVLILGLTSAILCACGSDKIDLTGNKNINDAIDAATGPLQDLNLRRHEIPPMLVQAAVNPYKVDKGIKCADVKKEVAALDELLGPDVKPKNIKEASGLDGPFDNVASFNVSAIEMPDSEEVMESAGDMIKGRAMSLIRSQTDIIPFRSIIRSVTGASKHQKRLAAAYEAGKLRRAYLKGMAEIRFGEKCLAPTPVLEAKVIAKTTPETAPVGDPNAIKESSDE